MQSEESIKNKINIFLICFSLSKGGAERVFSIIANSLDKSRYNITFITIKTYENEYQLNGNVKYIALNKSKTILACPEIFRLIWSHNPNIVFSTILQVNIVIGMMAFIFRLLRKKIIFIMRETSLQSINIKISRYSPSLLTFLINRTYTKFDCIIAQGVSMKEDLVKNFKIKSNKIKIINNPVDIFNSPILERSRTEPYKLITVGNLKSLKGYDRLLKIIKILKTKINLKYFIIGEGDKLNEIKETIKNYEIEKECHVLGSIDNVKDYLLDSDLFLQGSYFEGFPNVIIEAHQTGLPVVAFDVPGGTKEIIDHGKNGYLVDDNNFDSFVEYVLKALKTKFNNQEIAESTNNRFSKSKIIQEYDNLFSALLKTRSHE